MIRKNTLPFFFFFFLKKTPLLKVGAGAGFSGGSDSEESGCNAGDLGLIPGSGRSPGKGMTTHPTILLLKDGVGPYF